ncbi:hypothetical protein NliqN6_2374 [Naganishia liquefaciens]|uniref:UBC core domain-containing protein n=1 Tax=Naganishia liquefaciens TaxID=104408 RepID=A0A8H3TRQ4_9TREE|nr:hypothetical protein NliqN6_2374 [Naganishia liquefaciens]
MATLGKRRLAKELTAFKNEQTPAGVHLLRADDLETWYISVQVLGESLYKGQVFALRFFFEPNYPIEAPQVTFYDGEIDGVRYRVPVHPHIYTNGHICASTLADGWSPVLTVSSVAITLQSILASNTKLEHPEGNDRYVAHAPSNPKKTRWDFHDDTV